MIRRLWRKAVVALLQNGYSDDAALTDSGWRGKLAAFLIGTKVPW